MEVSGYPHFENVASNILAFFFTSDEEHGLGDLFFKSLMEIILGNTVVETNNINAKREYPTSKGNRIDIVLSNDSYMVGIENKIFSGVGNDLLDYMNTINKLAVEEKSIPINIILSLRDEKKIANMNGYHHVTYELFFEVIRRNLGGYIQSADNSWLIYLKDFMKTINELDRGGIIMNSGLCNFITQNKSEVENLIRDCNNLKKEMTQSTKKIKVMNLDKYRNSMKIVDYCRNFPNEWTSSYVIDIEKSADKTLVIETYSDLLGWHIAIWDRWGGIQGKEAIKKVLGGLNMSYHNRHEEEPNRSMFVVVEDYNHETTVSFLTDRIYKMMDLAKTIQI